MIWNLNDTIVQMENAHPIRTQFAAKPRCAIYHMKYGLPKMKTARKTFKVVDYPKMSIALDNIGNLIARIKEAEADHEDITLTADEKRFYDAFDEHWVHADKRVTLADYICRKLNKSLAG